MFPNSIVLAYAEAVVPVWLTLSLAYVFTFVNKFWIILFVANAVCLVDV